MTKFSTFFNMKDYENIPIVIEIFQKENPTYYIQGLINQVEIPKEPGIYDCKYTILGFFLSSSMQFEILKTQEIKILSAKPNLNSYFFQFQETKIPFNFVPTPRYSSTIKSTNTEIDNNLINIDVTIKDFHLVWLIALNTTFTFLNYVKQKKTKKDNIIAIFKKLYKSIFNYEINFSFFIQNTNKKIPNDHYSCVFNHSIEKYRNKVFIDFNKSDYTGPYFNRFSYFNTFSILLIDQKPSEFQLKNKLFYNTVFASFSNTLIFSFEEENDFSFFKRNATKKITKIESLLPFEVEVVNAYINQGFFKEANILLDSLVASLNKSSNPLTLLFFGYFHLNSYSEKNKSIVNIVLSILLDSYDSLPDTYILYAAFLIKKKKYKEAVFACLQIYFKGLPFYVEGIRVSISILKNIQNSNFCKYFQFSETQTEFIFNILTRLTDLQNHLNEAENKPLITSFISTYDELKYYQFEGIQIPTDMLEKISTVKNSEFTFLSRDTQSLPRDTQSLARDAQSLQR